MKKLTANDIVDEIDILHDYVSALSKFEPTGELTGNEFSALINTILEKIETVRQTAKQAA